MLSVNGRETSFRRPVKLLVSMKGSAVTVSSSMALSNVVLLFQDGSSEMFDGLHGYSETFTGTGGNADKVIAGTWIASGGNYSGDCQGCGEFVATP